MMTEQETKAIDQSRQGVAITDLAAQARAAHENCLRHGRKAIEHYLKAGHILLEARERKTYEHG